MTEPTASTSLSQLEAALRANGIQVTDGAVQDLLDQRQWIYPSERVEHMMEKLNEEEIYSVFNSQHHLQSSTQLFQQLASRRKKVSVVYGHKAHGKTQFLFFLFKLLQAMGQKVLFLDKTIMPSKRSGKIDINNSKFCGLFWKAAISNIEDSVNSALDVLFRDADPRSFGEFLDSLVVFTRKTGKRIWIIVDEVVLFENFPIDLPEEQDLGPFNWIVTGSAGIGSWVSKRHLEKLVLDLPLFTKEECFEFAINLCNSLGINLENVIDGVPLEGIDDWLDERFGGVVGYIAEMLLEISKGSSVSQYMSSLSARVKRVISNTATKHHISQEQLVKDWLNEIKSDDNTWDCLRDAGLCGSSAPRGFIFSTILKWLYTFSPEVDELSLVHRFRVMFRNDPGLDGCLLELEEILKLKANHFFHASLLSLDGHHWIVKESLDLPPSHSNQLSIFQYVEDNSRLDEISISEHSKWNLVQVPSGFDVIDVILVDVSGSPAIYGIQITRSLKPFAKHHTFDTCLPRSTERLEKLWSVIIDTFNPDGDKNSVRKFFVMLAPNCDSGEYRPSGIHSSDYFFAPQIAGLPAPLKKRRTGGTK